MNKRIIIIAASLFTLALSGSIIYWVAPSTFSNIFSAEAEDEQEVEPIEYKRPTINDHLKADFIKIADYYKKPEMSFIQTITKYSGEDFSTAKERSTNMIYKGTDYYFSEGPDQIMMCNAQVSLLIDKPNAIVYMDSAWDMNALMPYTNNILELLGSFQKIEKKEVKGNLVEYTIPSNQEGVEYSLLTTNLNTGQIKKMVVHGKRSLPRGKEEKGKIVVDYTVYNLKPEISDDKLDENNYIRGKGKSLKGSKTCKGYKVISKNTIYEQ